MENSAKGSSCCHSHKASVDWFFIVVSTVLILALITQLALQPSETFWWGRFCLSCLELLSTMWWGIVLGVFFVGLLHNIPREAVASLLGQGNTVQGLLRATLAGLLLDLCSHGILLVGMKLYERGASLGQTMAFLIASPWNSLSLTIILVSLVGLPWTITFVVLSAVIAFSSGLIFELLVKRGVLPNNPHLTMIDHQPLGLLDTFKLIGRSLPHTTTQVGATIKVAILESRMIVRWLLLGILIASALRASLSPEQFQAWFGPHMGGLVATLIFATIFEACSEGSTPIAADILTLGNAPGNAFAFLMTGVATDYTEVLSIKQGTGSWRIALFLPLITVPQVVILALILNS